MEDAPRTARAQPESGPLRGPFGARAFSLGRLFGIEIGLDPSWIFIFLLVTLSLSQQLATDHAGWTGVEAWGAGLVASLLFFVGILLHELGHSLTSQAFGLPVKSITLFVFGGLARLSGEPRRPAHEFWIAIAGPAVSLGLGVLFLALAAALPSEPRGAQIVEAVCAWLGRINIALAVFNAVPGFPLDGGRVLRSILWASTGDFHAATRVASAMGSAFAVGLIGLGAVMTLMMGFGVGGLWLVLIGFFLRSASRGAALQSDLQRSLGEIRVGEAMSPECHAIDGTTTVAELEYSVLHRGERLFCVGSGDRLEGLVTLQEIRGVPAGERPSTPARSVMIPRERLATVGPDDTLWDALRRMDELSINQLPVAAGERMIGMLTRERVLRVVRNQMEFGRIAR